MYIFDFFLHVFIRGTNRICPPNPQNRLKPVMTGTVPNIFSIALANVMFMQGVFHGTVIAQRAWQACTISSTTFLNLYSPSTSSISQSQRDRDAVSADSGVTGAEVGAMSPFRCFS